MKLRNKKTGEIMDEAQYRNYSLSNGFGFRMSGKEWEYHSLAELNEEWEDYQESKNYFYLTAKGNIHNIEDLNDDGDEQRKAIGNYFETKEEAEKVVEKLKAWKRLKDAGLSFHLQKQFRGDGIGYSRTIYTDFTKDSQEIVKDLDLLFGVEE